RGRTYDLAAYSGVAARAPVPAAASDVAVFYSLGHPGNSGACTLCPAPTLFRSSVTARALTPRDASNDRRVPLGTVAPRAGHPQDARQHV
ncbi:NADH-quinone oxidoreductase subunit M, partial [Streptomyces sp. JV186]|nr:NADH-quinone oxidoreductase subunit M [Streptomyces sp. JV186]